MSPLTVALRANALSCLVFGIAFLIVPSKIAGFLGSPPTWSILTLGAMLLANAAHLAWASSRTRAPVAEVLWFSWGDFVWWAGSVALIALGHWVTTPGGVAATTAVAILVAGFGIAQLFALGLIRTGLSAREHWARIGQSWMGLPRAVKLWLFVLNGVFLAALAFWPQDIARYTLASYIASGPLLLGIAALQGGLTRSLGIAHLLTWLPLAVWLPTHINTLSPMAAYALGLLVVILLCLALDLWDLWRWLRGERAVLGLGTQPSGRADQR